MTQLDTDTEFTKVLCILENNNNNNNNSNNNKTKAAGEIPRSCLWRFPPLAVTRDPAAGLR